MRLLLVAYQFPPYNSIGAIRMGKFARFLSARGHQVKVLAAKEPPLPTELPVEIRSEQVTYTPWFNVNFLPEFAFGGKKKVQSKGYKTKSGFTKKLGFLYQALFNFPDERIGWLPYAINAGKKLLSEWQPDLIYASMPPATTLLIASRLSSISGIPWVAEFRDLWVDNANYVYPQMRRGIERRIESASLRNVSGMITVSQPWANLLQHEFGKPVEVVMNGYAAEDMPAQNQFEATDSGTLQIVYTGTLYPHSQDISSLFAALEYIGEKNKKIHLVFYSRYLDWVEKLADDANMLQIVQHHALVPYHESLRVQRSADVLLYLIPNQDGFVPAKLFEYLAARRPILAIGNPDSIPGHLIHERRAGFASNDPDEIARQLGTWLDQKRFGGLIPYLPPEVCRGLSRDEQFEKAEIFLRDLIDSKNCT